MTMRTAKQTNARTAPGPMTIAHLAAEVDRHLITKETKTDALEHARAAFRILSVQPKKDAYLSGVHFGEDKESVFRQPVSPFHGLLRMTTPPPVAKA
jgi:hypothetical protein